MATKLQKAQSELAQLEQRANEIKRETYALANQADNLRDLIGNGIANGTDTSKQEAELDRVERRLKVMTAGQDAISAKLATQRVEVTAAQHEADEVSFDEVHKNTKAGMLALIAALAEIKKKADEVIVLVNEIDRLQKAGVRRGSPYSYSHVSLIKQAAEATLASLLSDSQLKSDSDFAEIGKDYARIW